MCVLYFNKNFRKEILMNIKITWEAYFEKLVPEPHSQKTLIP